MEALRAELREAAEPAVGAPPTQQTEMRLHSNGWFSPAEALWDLSKAIHRKQEGGVAIATQTPKEVTCGGKSLLCGCVFRNHGDRMKQEVLQAFTELLVTQEFRIWPTVVG